MSRKAKVDMSGWTAEEIAAGEQRRPGLYKNGDLWWLRTVRSPTGTLASRRLSTGERDLKRANRVAILVEEFQDSRPMWDWIDAALRSEVTLSQIYRANSEGSLHQLRNERNAAVAQAVDIDVEPFTSLWLESAVDGRDIASHTRDTYENQLRHLIPAGVRFPRSQFNQDYVLAKLNGLTTRDGKPASGSTKVATMNTWAQFYRWAANRVPLIGSPFEDIEKQDLPKKNPPRATFWDHAFVLKVLDTFPSDDRKAAATLIFGAGVEEGALLDIEGQHIIGGTSRKIIVPGSKTYNRVDRPVFVDAWAWPTIKAQADGKKPMEKLFDPIALGCDARRFRETLYQVQVALEMIPEPPVSEKTGKKLWGQVKKHDVHDARHTYAMIRLLGLDGARRESFKYVANQLGHADEQMVMSTYSKCRGDEFLRLIELQEAREAGKTAVEIGAEQGIQMVR